MAYPLSKTTAALVCVVAPLGFAAPALAAPALPLPGATVVIPVIDEETAVEEALEPDVVQPGSGEGIEQPAASGPPVSEQEAVEQALEPEEVMKAPKGEGSGGGDGSAGEIPALQEAFPETNWPGSDRKE
ncbi:MAG: hypothetical protein R3D30_00240 [Hyphomicrobiales bacterium]